MKNDPSSYRYTSLGQEVRASRLEIDEIGASIDQLGGSRVMVLCGQNILSKSNVIQRVESAIGGRLVGRFDGVVPHAPEEAIRAARDMAINLKADILVSVGGGSAVMVAKGLALLLSTDKELSNFRRVRDKERGTVLPATTPLPEVKVKTISVTTTMGCAEIGKSGGAYSTKSPPMKNSLHGDGRTSPKVIVIDGEALSTTPPSILKSTAAGQLRIAVEVVASNKHNPLADAVGLQSIRWLYSNLKSGWQTDADYMVRVKTACCLASHAQSFTGALGINSAISHQVGAISDVPHGEVNALLLPHTIRFNAEAAAGQYRLVASSFEISDSSCSPKELAAQLAARISSICSDLGLPSRLRDIGVSYSALDSIVLATMSDNGLSHNSRRVDNAEEIREILENAW